MEKIIVSSAALHKALCDIFHQAASNDEEVMLKCNSKQLKIGNSRMVLGVESRSIWEVEISVGKLRKLFLLLGRVEEQPLVINFQNGQGWIQIYNLVV